MPRPASISRMSRASQLSASPRGTARWVLCNVSSTLLQTCLGAGVNIFRGLGTWDAIDTCVEHVDSAIVYPCFSLYPIPFGRIADFG